MSNIDIHLPDKLQGYLNDQVTRRGYKNASEFVKELIEADRQRQVRQEVESMLLETIDGPFDPWTNEDVDDIRAVGHRLIEKRRAK